MPIHGVPASRLVDAHIHIRDVKGLETVAAAGVVAVRDAGFRRNTEHGAVDLRGGENRSVVISSRWAIYKKGGYGSLIGLPVETRNEMRNEILTLKRAGADIIKVMASGIVSFKEPGRVTAGGFNADELRFIVHEAATVGLSVMAHANGEAAIMACAEAGVRSVEHGFFMTGRALELLAKKGAFWVPTIGALARAAEFSGASEDARKYVDRLIRSHLSMIGCAQGMLVPLAVGTDCVLPDPAYHDAYDAELAYFEQAGISPGDVLRIAREGGAKLLRINS
jgi:hypothetical protein